MIIDFDSKNKGGGGKEPVVESLSVTENGTYNAPSNIDGYNTVSVNVPQSGGTGFDFNQLNKVIFRTNGATLDLTGLDTSTFNTMSNMFSNCSYLTSLDLSSFNTSNVTDMNSMFSSCVSIESIYISNWDTSKVANMIYMFYHCSKITSLDLSHFNTRNVTNMNSMFCDCENLTSLNISNWDTSKVTNMDSMFSNCRNLASLDISNWNTSNVTSMNTMFYYCLSLETIISDGLQLPDINLSNIGLDSSPLTVDSIVGLLNALPTTTNGYSFQIGSTNIAKLSEDQKAIATTKGWQLV